MRPTRRSMPPSARGAIACGCTTQSHQRRPPDQIIVSTFTQLFGMGRVFDRFAAFGQPGPSGSGCGDASPIAIHADYHGGESSPMWNRLAPSPTGACRRAFALWELGLSVLLIAILLSVLLPLLSAARVGSYREQCAANQRRIG